MRKTKIVCTIGPASDNEEILKKLMLAGMNAARINFSHGSFKEQEEKIKKIKKVSKELGLNIPLILDTKGPEVRIGKFEDGEIFLKPGDTFSLVPDEIMGTQYEFSVSYKDLYKELKHGDKLLIDDGLIEVEVITIKDKKIYCKVISGGKLSNRKSINIPGKRLNLPSLTEKDRDDILNGIKADFDFIAASFIRSAKDVMEIRKLLNDNGGENIKIISKIENQEGVDNFDEILDVSDGIMVARGDLSVEIPMAKVPMIQKEFIKKTYLNGKIVITATQMLESMINNPRPTRAEVSDISNAIYDATSAIMLSGETATGKYPVDCVEMMSNISEETENAIHYWKRYLGRNYDLENKGYRFSLYNGIAAGAMNLKAKAILAYTLSGDTPGILSAFCPTCPIYAITGSPTVARQMNLCWNVFPILVKNQKNVDKMLETAIDELRLKGEINKGDILLIAGGAEILPDVEDAELNKVIGGIIKV
ncbi:MAG: pyruvate kinase [Clostridia bacterium]|nr:pyruvate kinase [Clostridia bacterium]